MRINDLVAIEKAKIKDTNPYLPRGYFEALERIRLRLRKGYRGNNAEEVGNAIDDFWLLEHRKAGYNERLITGIKRICEQEIDSRITPILNNLLQRLEPIVEQERIMLESIRVCRDKYYEWVRGEISFNDVISFIGPKMREVISK